MENNWVSVKDKLPEDNKDRLLLCDTGQMAIGNYECYSNSCDWYASGSYEAVSGEWNGTAHFHLDGDVTHWTDLPEKPE